MYIFQNAKSIFLVFSLPPSARFLLRFEALPVLVFLPSPVDSVAEDRNDNKWFRVTAVEGNCC